jgi:hypothetical protein
MLAGYGACWMAMLILLCACTGNAAWLYWICWQRWLYLLEWQDIYSGSAGWMAMLDILPGWICCLCWLAVYARLAGWLWAILGKLVGCLCCLSCLDCCLCWLCWMAYNAGYSWGLACWLCILWCLVLLPRYASYPCCACSLYYTCWPSVLITESGYASNAGCAAYAGFKGCLSVLRWMAMFSGQLCCNALLAMLPGYTGYAGCLRFIGSLAMPACYAVYSGWLCCLCCMAMSTMRAGHASNAGWLC